MEAMLIQATIIETKRKQASHEAVLNAIGGAFSKTGDTYAASQQKIIDSLIGKKSAAKVGDVEGLRRDLRGGKRRKKK